MLRRRWWLILVGPALGAALGITVTLALGTVASDETEVPVHRATALVLMEGREGLGNSPDLAEVRPVLQNTADKLEPPMSVSELRAKVTANPVSGSNLMEISAEDSDQGRAITIANAVSTSLVEYITSLRQAQSNASSPELDQQLQDLAYLLSGAGGTNSMYRPLVVAPAEVVPQSAVSGPDSVLRNILLAIFVGALASVGAVMILEHQRQPVSSPEQLEKRYGLAPLGSVPRWRQRTKDNLQLMIDGDSGSAAGEAVRKVATNLVLAALHRGAKTLLVVSPDTGDGRSSLLANVGVALADSWNEVVLVDTDLRLPSLHRLFGLNNEPGLSSLLGDPTMTISEVMQETMHKRLKVVASGPVPVNPLEQLRCPRMTWLLEQLKKTSDIVLLDSPPALAVTDAMHLASLVDGVVLVIDADSASWEEVRTIHEGLNKVGTPVVGYVWNRATLTPWTFPASWQRYYRKLELRPNAPNDSRSGKGIVMTSQESEDALKHLASKKTSGTEYTQLQSS